MLPPGGMKRLRQDVDWLVSAGLLLSVIATALTGVVADLWDLNDFWYHTVSGYVMAAFAGLHVVLNWERLVGYAKFRLRSLLVRPTHLRSCRLRARAGGSGRRFRARDRVTPRAHRSGRRRRCRRRSRQGIAARATHSGRVRRRRHLSPVEQARCHRR